MKYSMKKVCFAKVLIWCVLGGTVAAGYIDTPDIVIGLLSPSEPAFINTIQIKPAVDMALEAVARRVRAGQYPNMSLSVITNDTGSGCGDNEIRVLAIAARMFINSAVYCYIGPPCSGESTAAGELATYLNIPIITATMPSLDFINKKSRFRTMTRTSYELRTIIKVMLSTLHHFRWSNFAFIYEFPRDNASLVLLDFNIPFSEFTDNEFAVRYISMEETDALDDVLLSAIEKNRGRS